VILESTIRLPNLRVSYFRTHATVNRQQHTTLAVPRRLPQVDSNPQVLPSSAKSLRIALWTLVAIWIVSFFLPAFVDIRGSLGGGPSINLGLEAAVCSILTIPNPIYGVAWTANIFMIIAPFLANRAYDGKARAFAILFYLSALIGWLCAFAPFRFSRVEVGYLTTGYFVWLLSILSAATLFLATAFRRWLVAIPSGLLVCSLVYAPQHMLNLRYDRIVQNANAILYRVESGGPGPSSVNEAFGQDWNIVAQRRYFEISSAMEFLREIEVCKQRERISDEVIVRTHHGDMIHAPDPGHIPQTPAPAGRESYCKQDESATKPWISGTDLERYNLSQAKFQIHNAQ
jgi:hypothetical protein